MSVANPVAGIVNSGREAPFAPSRALKHVYRVASSLYDRVLFPSRHSALLRRLSITQRPRRILVVCHGNVCRSPYLGAVLQRGLPDVEVISAGFVGSDRAVPPNAVALSARRGLDLSGYRSRPVTQSKISSADLVIVMGAHQAERVVRTFGVKRGRIVIAGDLDPVFEITRTIQDPWNQSIGVFESSFDRLDRCAATLVSALRPIG